MDAADAIDDAASWLNDFTIRLPPGPILGARWLLPRAAPPEDRSLLTGGGVADTLLELLELPIRWLGGWALNLVVPAKFKQERDDLQWNSKDINIFSNNNLNAIYLYRTHPKILRIIGYKR